MSYSGPSHLDRVRELLSQRAKNRKYIRGDQIVDFITRSTGYDRQAVLKCIAELKRTAEISCQDWYQGEPVGRLILNLKLSRSEAHLRWLQALRNNDLKPQDIDSLEPLHAYVDDWEDAALSRLVRDMVVLREAMPTLRGQSRYAVSARYLLGSSKIIDALPNSSLRAFGVDPIVLAKPPCYLMTAGPRIPEAVLLIENPQAFELAASTSIVETVGLVATFGYGLSRSGDDFGRQLASHIENNDPLIPLVRKGSPPGLESLLSHRHVYFWGDLDMEGMKIFWRLRSVIPQILLSALYLPMIQLLKSGASHPYSKITGKPNQQMWESHDKLVSHLLTLCLNNAVDQESVEASLLEGYADKPLEWGHLAVG